MTVTVYLLCPLRNVVRLDLFILRSPFHRLRSKPNGVNVFRRCVRESWFAAVWRIDLNCVFPCAVPSLHTFNHRYLCGWCEWMRCGQHSDRHLSLSVTLSNCARAFGFTLAQVTFCWISLFCFFFLGCVCVCLKFKIRCFCLCCHLFMGRMNAVNH